MQLLWKANTACYTYLAAIKQQHAGRSILTHLLGPAPPRPAVHAGAKTRDMPARITDYEPTDDDVGGLFDNRDRALRIYSDKAQK